LSGHTTSSVPAAATPPGPRTISSWEGQEYRGETWATFIGNAERIAGGSMRVCSGARVDDGEMNVVIMPARSKLASVRVVSQVPSGDHIEAADVSYFPTTQIEVDSDPPAVVEIDGDVFGTTPARFTLCPKAAEIVSPAPLGGSDPARHNTCRSSDADRRLHVDASDGS